jgi:hypothetical protein
MPSPGIPRLKTLILAAIHNDGIQLKGTYMIPAEATHSAAAINNLEWAWEPKAQNIGASPLPMLTMPTPFPQAGCEGERMIKTPSNAEYTKILQCTCSCTQVLMEKWSKMTCIWWKHRLYLIWRH